MSRSQALLEAYEVTLLDLVDRAIDLGGILTGDITIAVADIDLIYLRLQVLLASAERIGSSAWSGRRPWNARGARISL
jgi:gas vesicle structural protein